MFNSTKKRKWITFECIINKCNHQKSDETLNIIHLIHSYFKSVFTSVWMNWNQNTQTLAEYTALCCIRCSTQNADMLFLLTTTKCQINNENKKEKKYITNSGSFAQQTHLIPFTAISQCWNVILSLSNYSSQRQIQCKKTQREKEKKEVSQCRKEAKEKKI